MSAGTVIIIIGPHGNFRLAKSAEILQDGEIAITINGLPVDVNAATVCSVLEEAIAQVHSRCGAVQYAALPPRL